MDRISKNKDIGFMYILVFGIIMTIIGLVTIITGSPVIFVPMIIIGLLITFLGAFSFNTARRDREDLSDFLSEKLDSDSTGETDSNAKVFSSRHKRKITKIQFEYLFIEIKKPPEKAICMISRTTFEEKEEAIQCPNCENFFLKKYLMDWLKKNNSCPICKTILKTKKV